VVDDFWTQISLADFDDRTAHADESVMAFNEALEHWAQRQGQLLGVIARTLYDRD
jgi:hypothetical protein